MRDSAAWGLVAVDQDETGGWVQRLDGAPHGKHCCLEDIEGIDHLLLDYAEADGDRFGHDRHVESLALLHAERFGIIHPFDRARRWKNDGGSDDRPGQRPAPGLINARNKAIPRSTKGMLRISRRQRSNLSACIAQAGPLYLSLRSEIRAALPFSFRR